MEITKDMFNDMPVINLVGKLDTITSPDLQDKLIPIISEGHKKVLLNFTDITYISSSGLRVLLVGQKSLKPTGGEVILVGVNDSLKEIFNISGFTALFTFYDTLDQCA
jgi:anti-sigma B factor antagonist